MSHPEQRAFCDRVRKEFPSRFLHPTVLDIGALDVNGSNRWLFQDPAYLGIDIVPGPNVDRVCKVTEIEGVFDVVICTEVLEHDDNWIATVRGVERCTIPNGLAIITCAGPGRPEHGTRRRPKRGMVCTSDYYRNVSCKDLLAALDHDLWRTIYVAQRGPDTQFYGIRNGMQRRP